MKACLPFATTVDAEVEGVHLRAGHGGGLVAEVVGAGHVRTVHASRTHAAAVHVLRTHAGRILQAQFITL